VPCDEDLVSFYNRYSLKHQVWQSAKKRPAALKAGRRRRGGNGILLELARRRPIAGKKLIEFGCSRGSFLLDAREAGAIVSGMDLDSGACDFVSSLGIPCERTMTAALDNGPYDFVVALNLIEHLPQPKAWLKQISSVMTPGGLIVLWTPNGAQSAALGSGWVGFRVDLDHLTYFTATHLSRLLVEVDLWPEAVWELSQANLSGFTEVERAPGRMERLLKGFHRQPVQSWAIPPSAGAFTLVIFAGKPSRIRP
jgi:2-polyprenyl-3-methyl-5-hydroxy-6-metoxy-1,4-benzoquinol methylase